MQRGDIWWANVPDLGGSMPSFRRPVVIIQSNAFNQSRIATVIIALISSNLRLASASGNILIHTYESGLPKDSVINVSQIIAIDKNRLDEYVGYLPLHVLEKLDDGLRLVLDL